MIRNTMSDAINTAMWCYKHCYDYAILASPRDIWTCAKVCIMPWVDILSCEENAKLARIFQMCASCNSASQLYMIMFKLHDE